MNQQSASGIPSVTMDGETSGEADLIGRLGDVAGAHVAVIGGGALETMCALIRAGCSAVVEIAMTDRGQIEPVEIAVVPQAASLPAAARTVPLAMRALLPGGRIVLRDPTGLLGRDLGVMLRANGFSAVRVLPSDHGCVVSGERPIFGRMVAGARA
jgi:hypothetical protein